MRSHVTQERLISLIDYDPISGIAIWRIPAKSKKRKLQVGSPSGGGYLSAVIDGRMYLLHRLIWLYMTGEWPPRIDHRDLCSINNKWENLRLATGSQNMANRAIPKNNTSGFKGVSAFRKSGRWRATIKCEGKFTQIGVFATKEEAHAAYLAKARELFGEFARG